MQYANLRGFDAAVERWNYRELARYESQQDRMQALSEAEDVESDDDAYWMWAFATADERHIPQ